MLYLQFLGERQSPNVLRLLETFNGYAAFLEKNLPGLTVIFYKDIIYWGSYYVWNIVFSLYSCFERSLQVLSNHLLIAMPSIS